MPEEKEQEEKPGWLARQIEPSIERGAQKIKEGLYRVRMDFIVGALVGAATVIVIQDVFGRGK